MSLPRRDFDRPRVISEPDSKVVTGDIDILSIYRPDVSQYERRRCRGPRLDPPSEVAATFNNLSEVCSADRTVCRTLGFDNRSLCRLSLPPRVD
ncbi:hypothetical protein [Rhodococcus qingshengii]|uniref:hypothetical protein n=1 Tax=Rhodococcus qingshengii TaxID=334542 RepID=UPI0022B51BD8|nr:hypothetical protein [Rhodococcus qingshengii]MCZ4615200.1 hypothetical protein [Rhodococcus qingshengii]